MTPKKLGVDEGLFSVTETEIEGINNQMFSI